MKQIVYILLLTLLTLSANAQDTTTPKEGEEQEYVLSEQDIQQISEDISSYMSEVNSLISIISGARKMSNIKGLESSLQTINVRWTSYYSLQGKDISLNDVLTEMLAQYQELYNIASDSISKQKAIITAEDDFANAEKFLASAQKRYGVFIADANKWSLTSKTAKQLEGVKAEEQVFFQQVDKQYQAAQAAVALAPRLAERMAALEQVYINIKVDSNNVQATAYKPFLIRIKDYILSIAGVAIIILFLTMMQSKIAAARAAAKAAKEAKQKMMKANGDIPEI